MRRILRKAGGREQKREIITETHVHDPIAEQFVPRFWFVTRPPERDGGGGSSAVDPASPPDDLQALHVTCM